MTYIQTTVIPATETTPEFRGGHYDFVDTGLSAPPPDVAKDILPLAPFCQTYPFLKMDVGDSFFRIPLPGKTVEKLLLSIQHSARKGAARAGQYRARIVEEETELPDLGKVNGRVAEIVVKKLVRGVRCWRIK